MISKSQAKKGAKPIFVANKESFLGDHLVEHNFLRENIYFLNVWVFNIANVSYI